MVQLIMVDVIMSYKVNEYSNYYIDLLVKNSNNKTEIMRELRHIVNEFNAVEKFRKLDNKKYRPVNEVRFVKLVNVIKTNRLIVWRRRIRNYNNIQVWYDFNSGYCVLSYLEPSRQKLKDYFCKTCNRDFDTLDDYVNHKKLKSHHYCAKSVQEYPFWNVKFRELRATE